MSHSRCYAMSNSFSYQVLNCWRKELLGYFAVILHIKLRNFRVRDNSFRNLCLLMSFKERHTKWRGTHLKQGGIIKNH